MASSTFAATRLATERRLAHLIFSSRRWINGHVARVAPSLSGGRILEIGSGRQDLGVDAYSMKKHFDDSCKFIQTDFNPDFGHQVVDVTTMDFEDEFDAILCLEVLEHVPCFWEAIPRLHRALRPGGRLMVSTPMIFPYHDEPGDFYRFTEHGLQHLLSDFRDVEVYHRGLRRLPFTVLATGLK